MIKLGDTAQRIEAAAVGIAGKIVELFELAKDRHLDIGPERLLELFEGRQLLSFEQLGEILGMENRRPHNVNIPPVSAV